MSLLIYGHPLSPLTQKVLIALYENATPFEFHQNPVPFEFAGMPARMPDGMAPWLHGWPLRKFPLLAEGKIHIVETGLIIEYLQFAHPGPVRLLPDGMIPVLETRLMDGYFEQHVLGVVQQAVNSVLNDVPAARATGLAAASDALDSTYVWLERELAGRQWAAGGIFTMADCAAAPALCFANWIRPVPDEMTTLRAYHARLMARPSIARVLEEALPYRHLFPVHASRSA